MGNAISQVEMHHLERLGGGKETQYMKEDCGNLSGALVNWNKLLGQIGIFVLFVLFFFHPTYVMLPFLFCLMDLAWNSIFFYRTYWQVVNHSCPTVNLLKKFQPSTQSDRTDTPQPSTQSVQHRIEFEPTTKTKITLSTTLLTAQRGFGCRWKMDIHQWVVCAIWLSHPRYVESACESLYTAGSHVPLKCLQLIFFVLFCFVCPGTSYINSTLILKK